MPSASNSCARENARERELRLGERQRPNLRIAEHVADHVADERGLLGLVLADRGVARDHVAHFVRQHRGELGLVVGERDQSARDVEPAVRQREGVDRRRIEDGHLVFQVRPLGRRDQPVDGLLDHRVQPRVLVIAAIGGEDAQMLALRRRLQLGLRGGLRHRQRDLAVVRRAGAAGQSHGQSSQQCRPACSDFCVAMPALRINTSLDEFDLLGRLGVDDRAAALLDPSAHPDAAAFELFRLDARGGEGSPMAFKNGDGEVARPAPPEVHIYSGPALAHRQDLAFDQREMAPCGGNRARFSGRKGAKLGSAQSPRRAARAARSDRNRTSAQALSPIRAETRAWPCSTSISCTDCWRSPT